MTRGQTYRKTLGLYFGGVLLIGTTYLCWNTYRFGYSPHVQGLSMENEVNVTHDLSTPQTVTDVTFLKPMMNLPSWYKTGDWGLRKNVSLENVKPHNEWPSNDAEEIIAWNNFFYGTTNGIILELGAMDGKGWSVSQFFEAEAGWRSILIEGNPTEVNRHTLTTVSYNAAQLPINRPNAINFNVVICEEPRIVNFAKGLGTGGMLEFMTTGFLSTFHSYLLTSVENVMKLDDKKVTEAKNVIKLPCVPLSDILNPLKINHINFFMLDLEGGELTVLKAIDFDRIKFDVIAVETDREYTDSEEVTQKYVDSVIELLTSKGYVLWNRKLGRNSWFTNVNFTKLSKNMTTTPTPLQKLMISFALLKTVDESKNK